MIRWIAYRSPAGVRTTVAHEVVDVDHAKWLLSEWRRDGCTAVAMGSTPTKASERSEALLCRGCERGTGGLCATCQAAVLGPTLVASVAVCGTKRRVA